MTFYLALAGMLACSTLLGRAENTNFTAEANARTTSIVLKDKFWTIEELDKVARKHIWGEAGPPNEAIKQTMVQIRPQDKKVMCEFTYSAGFAKPFWRAKIGYDGRVLGVEKGIKREG